ncbi:hypothetical protein [Nocardioides sp.]|uniref:hypothetical protein n=1 Tax=Nocardioides sp. TaxID=35761 RepID=UPI0039E524E3
MSLSPRRLTSRGERGQSTAEYVGLATVVVAVIGLLLLVAPGVLKGAGGTIDSAFCHLASAVGGGGDCGSEDQSGGEHGGQDEGGDQGPDGRSGGPTNPEDVDIPDGLDPDSDLVKEMLSTQRGRDTLQWLADNDIPIRIDPGTTGAYWNGTEIVLGDGFTDPSTLVHEANHARYSTEGRSADVQNLSRDQYVHDMIAEETDGTVQQIQAAQEFRAAGYDVSSQPGEDQYTAAYDAAVQAGASDEEARQAGYDAVEQEFYNGGFVTSTNGQSYPDYYGGFWDRAH